MFCLLAVWWFVGLAMKVDWWPHHMKENFLDSINYGLAIKVFVKYEYDVNIQSTPSGIEGLSKLHEK
jgi:hypothetical protein